MSRDSYRAFTRVLLMLGLAVACGVTEFALPGSEDTTSDDSTTVDDDTTPMDDDVGEDSGSDADLPSDDSASEELEPTSPDASISTRPRPDQTRPDVTSSEKRGRRSQRSAGESQSSRE